MATARRNRGQGGTPRVWGRGMAALVSAALVGAPLPGFSQPSDLADLKNESENHAARELSRRGFFLTHSVSRHNAIHQFWWNSSRDYCVRIAIERNRVAEVRSSDDHDCNQRDGGSKGPSRGTQVAIAAAALLGVAALAHKSHDNNKERANLSPEEVADFERGYRDGLYHQGYHNYNNRRDYSDGYQKGQEARSSETAYRSNQGYHSGYCGLCQCQRPGRCTRRRRGERSAVPGFPQYQRLQGQRPRLHLLVERQHAPVHQRRGARRSHGVDPIDR